MSGTPDDYKVIPEKIQESIVKFIEETFFSEILTHIQRETPVLFGTPTKTVSPEHFFNIFSSLETPFVKNHRNDLMELLVVGSLPKPTFSKIGAKKLIEAAIRIVKDMGHHQMEEDLQNVVRGCCIPIEYPDLTCPSSSLSFDQSKYVSYYQSMVW